MTVVEAVGARLSGQASAETLVSRKMSLACARVEALQPLMVIRAAVGERQYDVAGGEHAKVAVNCFGSVQEVGLGAGGAKRCRDLSRDDAAFADAGDDDAAPTLGGLQQQIGRLREGGEHRIVEAESKLVEGGCLDAHELRRAQWV
jgi:hypothetical protein